MPIKSLMATMSVLGLLTVAGTANAGDCAGLDCRLDVSYIQGTLAKFGPMTVQDNQPMGHLRTVNFQRAPHVSIMRVHSLPLNVGLSDVPVTFTEGCHPQSTEYCRQDAGSLVSAEIAPPPQMPTYTPLPAPQMPAYAPQPQIAMPAPLQYSSQRVDYSLFQPRQYGHDAFVPGIAHVPTSFVDRSPENADRALNSGRTIAQPIANGGVAPRPSMMGRPMVNPPMMNRPMMNRPMVDYQMMGHSEYKTQGPAMPSYVPMTNYVAPQMAGAPVLQANGTYGSTVGADGTYWEKASGPAVFGDTLATQVICKRQIETRVVNPVVGVPVPSCNNAAPNYPGWTH